MIKFCRTIKAIHLSLSATSLSILLVMPQPVAAADQTGQQLYMVHCSGCHGATGISVVPDAKNFSRFELITQPDDRLLDVIRSGRNLMPGYLGILNDQQILNIIEHIRTLN